MQHDRQFPVLYQLAPFTRQKLLCETKFILIYNIAVSHVPTSNQTASLKSYLLLSRSRETVYLCYRYSCTAEFLLENIQVDKISSVFLYMLKRHSSYRPPVGFLFLQCTSSGLHLPNDRCIQPMRQFKVFFFSFKGQLKNNIELKLNSCIKTEARKLFGIIALPKILPSDYLRVLNAVIELRCPH